MNSSFSNNRTTSTTSSSSLNNYNFDFGFGSSRGSSRPLKDQKSNPTPSPSPSNRPSWTNQPVPSTVGSSASRSNLSAPSSMVGDIFGKTWTNPTPSSTSVGLPKADPNLFGDLLGSALGSKPAGNVPLKAAPPQKQTAFSMAGVGDSLPKTASTPMRPSVAPMAGSGKIGGPVGGAPGMKSSASKDPFGSLMDFKSKPSPPVKPSPPPAANPKPKPSGGGVDFSFGDFQNANSTKTDAFGAPLAPAAPSQPKSGVDPLDMLFSSSSSAAPVNEGSGGEMFSEANDWDMGGGFGGGNDGGGATTELEGLPPPPAGVTASMAKSKGLDNYKQGQFPDAIKWLSWATVLLEKSVDKSAVTEVLTCRAGCYKEVGEYKKAIADCSKILENDGENVAVLVQRALLYESTEKYKLGAEDLRLVLKVDPMNRLARTTIHRLTQLAG